MSGDDHASQDNLPARLRARIRRDGPISFHDWMQAALYDERDGYYSRPDLIRQGRAGDYRTAPETSPLFAVTFADYFMKSYFDLGAPGQWTIFEAGAATGEFARGVLSSLQSKFPKIFEATRYLIDEVGPAARAKAGAHLAEFAERVEFRHLREINEAFEHAIIFSNELIDAFPVHRVVGRNQTLRELCVGLKGEDFVLVERDLTPAVADYCARIRLRLKEGQIFEVNLGAEEFVARSAASLNAGLLITVDYGASRDELLNAPQRFEGTLRAFRRHKFAADPLANPGGLDLTTTIDWTEMHEAGARHGLETLRFERLDQFLLNGGLLGELLTLGQKNLEAAELFNLNAGALEMISPVGLAASFQVLIQRKVSNS